MMLRAIVLFVLFLAGVLPFEESVHGPAPRSLDESDGYTLIGAGHFDGPHGGCSSLGEVEAVVELPVGGAETWSVQLRICERCVGETKARLLARTTGVRRPD